MCVFVNLCVCACFGVFVCSMCVFVSVCFCVGLCV